MRGRVNAARDKCCITECPPGAYLKKLIEKVGIDNKVTQHKLRHTYATRLMEKDVQLVSIQALLGHEIIATTQIYTHAGQE